MKTISLILAFACMASTAANAACIAPKGRYGGAGAGLSINSAVSPMTIRGVESVRVFADYTSNGSGTMIFDVNVINSFFGKITATQNLTFEARGSANHTWNPTTCQGTLTVIENGSPGSSFWYSVVQSGKEIILNPIIGPAPFTITLKKL